MQVFSSFLKRFRLILRKEPSTAIIIIFKVSLLFLHSPRHSLVYYPEIVFLKGKEQLWRLLTGFFCTTESTLLKFLDIIIFFCLFGNLEKRFSLHRRDLVFQMILIIISCLSLSTLWDPENLGILFHLTIYNHAATIIASQADDIFSIQLSYFMNKFSLFIIAFKILFFGFFVSIFSLLISRYVIFLYYILPQRENQ